MTSNLPHSPIILPAITTQPRSLKSVSILSLALALSVLGGCKSSESNNKITSDSPVNAPAATHPAVERQPETTTVEPNVDSSQQTATDQINPKVDKSDNKQQQITQLAKEIESQLASHNYQAITPYIHPIKGVRFSMYAYVQKDSDKVFNQAQFEQYLQASRVKFTWGAKDGTGDIYLTSLPDYLADWVDNAEYDPKSASFNEFQGSGNSLNNLKAAYPNADFVEFYFPGTKQYEGIDWRSLRLVFETYQGQYYLVGIINDQWTV